MADCHSRDPFTSGVVRYVFILYRRGETHIYALTVTAGLAKKMNIRTDSAKQLARFTAGLMALEGKPLVETLRRAIGVTP